MGKEGANHVALRGQRGFEPAGAGVEHGIVAQIFDRRAGVTDSGAVARESFGAGGNAGAERDMVEIDGELTRPRDRGAGAAGEKRSAKGAPCAAAAAAALSPGMSVGSSNIEVSSWVAGNRKLENNPIQG